MAKKKKDTTTLISQMSPDGEFVPIRNEVENPMSGVTGLGKQDPESVALVEQLCKASREGVARAKDITTKILVVDDQSVSFDLTLSLTNPLPQVAGSETSDSNSLGRKLGQSIPLAMPDRYEDIGILGTGGMGTVRQVRDRLVNRVLAMKVLHTQLVEETSSLMRFVQEAQVCAQLQHPNILPIYDLGVLATGHLYFTMAEIKGDSLDVYIKRVHDACVQGQWSDAEGEWNLYRLVAAFYDVCKAASHAHEHGVVHRDLKPKNIMIGRLGEVLVVDWGLAKVIGQEDIEESVVTMRSQDDEYATVAGPIYGTPAYVAPEIAMGQGDEANERTDIYALGTVLYEILRGRRAFAGKNLYSLLMNVVSNEPSSFLTPEDDYSACVPNEYDSQVKTGVYVSYKGAALPSVLVEVCQRAMDKDPMDRFGSVSEMIEIIGQWLDGSKRREHALSLVARAHEYGDLIASIEEEIQAFELAASVLERDIKPWESETTKVDAWTLRDRSARLRLNARVKRAEQIQMYRASLAYKDDLPEAHCALASYYQAVHQEAEERGEVAAAQEAEVALREHVGILPAASPDRALHQAYLDGTGSLTLHTVPTGGHVSMTPLMESHRKLVPGETVHLGVSPCIDVAVKMGSYMVKISHPGYHDTIYPVYNGRSVVSDGCDATGDKVWPLELLPEGLLGPNDCYVPAGWCWLGGDPHTPNSLPRMRVWIDGFVIDKFAVTHAQYLEFLNDLMVSGNEDLALRHVPREQSSAGEGSGTIVYTSTSDGLFQLPTDPKRSMYLPDQPVTMIQWSSARSYGSWYADKSGLPWRLPMEFEWEKAARGVDGRSYPWGDAFDPSWACMKDSHKDEVRMQVVDSFPYDESIYGVRGTAGNTRDWCLDRFRENGPPLKNSRLVMPNDADLADMGFKSTRGGSYGNSASRARSADRDWWFPDRSYVGRGFRLLWSLSQWRERPHKDGKPFSS